MKCVLLQKVQELVVCDCKAPRPNAREVLVEMEMAAICGSDYALYQGKYGVPLPVIPGHEGIGRIVVCGEQVQQDHPQINIGDRVVINPNFSCGTCSICQRGDYNVCPAKVRLGIDVNGVFAEKVAVPATSVMVLPEKLAAEKAIFIEPLAVVYHALRKARPDAGQRVLVIGAGVMGLLMIQLARRSGAHVIALDPLKARSPVAQKLGASQLYHHAAGLKSLPPFDIIFETSGAPETLEVAVQAAAPAGRIILVGLPATPHAVSSALIVRKELQIAGSMIYTHEFGPALALLEQDGIDVYPLISNRCRLQELPQQLAAFQSAARIKTLVELAAV